MQTKFGNFIFWYHCLTLSQHYLIIVVPAFIKIEVDLLFRTNLGLAGAIGIIRNSAIWLFTDSTFIKIEAIKVWDQIVPDKG